MDSSTLPVDTEVSLRSIVEKDRFRTNAGLVILFTVAVLGESCSKSANPSAPDQPQEPYLGTWTGTVTSDVIGLGTGTVTLDSGIKSSSGPFLNGSWSFVFNDARFNASGTVSGGFLPDRTIFVLVFSPSLVPCPSEPGGASERTRAASLMFTPSRMQGTYIAGGCPGGSMDLGRK